MNSLKSDIIDRLMTDQNRLHEIELEDIQLEPVVQKNIYKTIARMFSPEAPIDPVDWQILRPIGEIACKGYWVEDTKELLLYVWIGEQSKAIIIPKDGWDIREDIIFH